MGYTPNTTTSNELYAVANSTVSSSPFVVLFTNRDPTGNDLNYPIQKIWLNTSTNIFWFLKNFISNNGNVQANWIMFNQGIFVETLTGDDAVVVDPVNNNIDVLGNTVSNGTNAKPVYFKSGGTGVLDLDVQVTEAAASSDINNAGLASFNDSDFSVDSNGYVSALATVYNYTNVTHADSPYTVLVSDNYISVDCSGGTVTLNFPNAPVFKQRWTIKDRTGSASTNNITITTPGGSVTIDGLTSYVMKGNFDAVNLLANATPTYEVW